MKNVETMRHRARDFAADLLRAARADVHLSQTALAVAAGISRSTLAAYESGRRRPQPDRLREILIAARTRPSIPLAILADQVRAAASMNGLDEVRVFGSILYGRDTERSDIDLLVRARPDTSIIDVAAFALDVEGLTGFRVDVVTDTQQQSPALAHILSSAVLL